MSSTSLFTTLSHLYSTPPRLFTEGSRSFASSSSSFPLDCLLASLGSSSFSSGDGSLSGNSTPPTWLTQTVVRLPQDPGCVILLFLVRLLVGPLSLLWRSLFPCSSNLVRVRCCFHRSWCWRCWLWRCVCGGRCGCGCGCGCDCGLVVVRCVSIRSRHAQSRSRAFEGTRLAA